MTPRVFVVKPYLPNGGTFMAYHMAKILHEDFGFDGVAVGGPRPDHGIFGYDLVFPMVDLEAMPAMIAEDDLLICNPSFSPALFGLRCKGRKVMYIQDFKTFQLLDCRFDLYVSVGSFVRDFIRNTYAIATDVIAPFIRAERFPASPPWAERPVDSILVMLKGDLKQQQLWLDVLRGLVKARRPDIGLDSLCGPKMRQEDFLARVGAHRHLLSLSPAEGFGLMPLEAMAMGTTVLGFDAFGGRDYMRPGENCAVEPYPRIEAVADRIIDVLQDPAYAAALARAGQADALSPHYGYQRFRSEWSAAFASFLGRGRR